MPPAVEVSSAPLYPLYDGTRRAEDDQHPLAHLMRLRDEAAAEIERLLTFLDKSDGLDADFEHSLANSVADREESTDGLACYDDELDDSREDVHVSIRSNSVRDLTNTMQDLYRPVFSERPKAKAASYGLWTELVRRPIEPTYALSTNE